MKSNHMGDSEKIHTKMTNVTNHWLGLGNWEFGNGKSETGKGKKEKGNCK